MIITRQMVLAEAGSISIDPEAIAGIIAAVRAAPRAEIAGLAELAREDGLESEGAIAHEVAAQIAMDAGVQW